MNRNNIPVMIHLVIPRDWVCPDCGMVNYEGTRCAICDGDKPSFNQRFKERWSDMHQIPNCVMNLRDRNYVAMTGRQCM